MALGRYKALKEVRYGYGRQVGQLAGIEERTSTGIALFKPDMRLLGVDQSIHLARTARASIVLDLVLLLAGYNITDVERGSRLLVTELAELAAVKPQAATR